MSRTLNVDRMRRYVARTTPDRLTVEECMEDTPEQVAARVARWAERMTVKHGPNPVITTWRDPMTLRGIVEAEPRRGR